MDQSAPGTTSGHGTIAEKRYCLLFHILIDDHETVTISGIKLAVDTLREKLGQATVGFVFYLPADGIIASRSAPGPAEKSHRKGRRRVSGERLETLIKAGAPLADTYHDFVGQLGLTATDINYVDDVEDGLVRAIRFYVATQVMPTIASSVRSSWILWLSTNR